MKNKLFLSLSLLFVSVAQVTIDTPAEAAPNSCKVTDPTGTPINVRNFPNGRVINSLRNGRDIEILEIANDELGRPWAKVAGEYQGQYRVWGWVFREFISCY